MRLAKRAWQRVHRPRVISAAYAVIYLTLGLGGLTALIDPPSTIEGALGEAAMTILAALLVLGGVTGAPSALIGSWWLERIAVMSVAFSASMYGAVILTKHLTEPGNRQLQLSFVATVLLMQLVRWYRIHRRPYGPDRHP